MVSAEEKKEILERMFLIRSKSAELPLWKWCREFAGEILLELSNEDMIEFN